MTPDPSDDRLSGDLDGVVAVQLDRVGHRQAGRDTSSGSLCSTDGDVPAVQASQDAVGGARPNDDRGITVASATLLPGLATGRGRWVGAVNGREQPRMAYTGCEVPTVDLP